MATPTPSPLSQPPSIPPTLPPTPSYTTTNHHQPPSKSPINFSPPLIAMVIVAAAAFLFITYSRLISRHLFPPLLRLFHRHRRRHNFPSPPQSPPTFETSDGFYYGLDESVIKTIPLTYYNLGFLEYDDCAVCLLEFIQGESIRTLPQCCHSFHVDCIDMWLRSHATCPLCRAAIYLAPPPFESSPLTPLMAARIRPNFDDRILLESIFLEIEHSPPRPPPPPPPAPAVFSPEIIIQDYQCRDFLLKRSYSFGYERSFFPSEDITGASVPTAATTPHHHRNRGRFFWTKIPSSTPFSSLAKSRVFSFRRNLKSSPAFFRRRSFFPVSESSGISSRRVTMKPLASPLFGRGGVFSSSRMRMGDPEALISPERYNRR